MHGAFKRITSTIPWSTMDCVPPFKCGNTDSERIGSTRFELLQSLGLQFIL